VGIEPTTFRLVDIKIGTKSFGNVSKSKYLVTTPTKDLDCRKDVPTVIHNCIYVGLLFAACFDFCEQPLSGNEKYTKKDNLITRYSQV